jgi:hypothetical protein
MPAARAFDVRVGGMIGTSPSSAPAFRVADLDGRSSIKPDRAGGHRVPPAAELAS